VFAEREELGGHQCDERRRVLAACEIVDHHSLGKYRNGGILR
jgi:hypothetical protein